MAWILSIVSAVSLAAAALWTSFTEPVSEPTAPVESVLWPGGEAWARTALDTLTLDQRAGQLVVARLDGEIDVDALRLAAAGRLGGIERPLADEGAHLDLLRRWQTDAAVPLLVLERPGGAAREGAAPLLLGAAAQPDLTYIHGRASAEAAATLGVHVPAAPLFVSPGSTPFGDPALGADALGVALVRGLRDGRVLPAATVDGPVTGDALAPLVRAGLMSVRVHLDGAPGAATQTIRRLRDGVPFNGLIIAEAGQATSVEALTAAVQAGADLVVTSDPEEAGRILAGAVRAGTLDPGRLDDASRRVLAAKAWSGLDVLGAPPPRGADEATSDGPVVRVFPWRPLSPTYRRRAALLEQALARRAVTVVQDEGGPLPLVGPAAPARVLTLLLDPSASAEAGLPFANAVSTGFDGPTEATYVRLGLGASADRYEDAAASARGADVVVVGAFGADGALAARHRAFLDALLASGRPVVLAAFGPPSLAAGLPRPAALVAAYDGSEAAQRAAAEAVLGQIPVGGRLPVSVAGVAPAGAGVRYRQQALRMGSPEEAGLAPEAVEQVRRVVEAAVRNGAFPGAAVVVGRAGVLVEMEGVGALTRGGPPVTPETAYDLASLTKVVGTTATVMRLVERGRIDLDAPVSRYVPDYRGLGKEDVTVRQLLTHSAGHRPFYPFYARGILDREGVLEFIHADTLRYRPGTRSVYSDFDMIVLGEVIEAVTGRPLDEAFEAEVFAPLGLTGTGFREPGDVDRTAAPTEYDRAFRGRTLQGEVHDEAAWVMGGVAGHAGLFSTARDLARFGFALANGGEAYGTRLFRRSTIDRFTERVRVRSTYPMGLGWMLQSTDRSYSSAGSLFGPRSFGHTGFTGTSIWVDPDQELFLVLLSNRVHPTRRNGRIREVRSELADAVAGAIRTAPGEAAHGLGFGPVPDDLPALAAR